MSKRSNLTRQLKELISNFLGANSEILPEPTGHYAKKNLDARRIKMLRLLVDLLLNTRFLRKETKLYISDRYITMAGVTDIMEKEGKETNVNTVQSTIYFDVVRINAKLTKTFLADIVEFNRNLDDIEQRIINTLIHFSKGHLFNNLAIKLPEHTVKTEASWDEFQDFIMIVGPYSYQQMAIIQENIPPDMLGYCKYLISSSLITDDEKPRRQMILDLLSKESVY